MARPVPGPGVWGEPRDHDEVIRVLRRAPELGVTLIDTADSYGPEVSERLIREALHPYPEYLVIATKAGLTRPGPGRWESNGKPEHLKTQAEKSLRLLGLERIELFQLHRIDPQVPLADQLGALVELRDEGKFGRIGLSELSVPEIQARARSGRSPRSRTPTTSRTAAPSPYWITASARASASSHGSRWPPASLPSRADRSNGSPTSTAPHLRSSRWRGCCIIARPWFCRSPALRRSGTSKRTLVLRRSS